MHTRSDFMKQYDHETCRLHENMKYIRDYMQEAFFTAMNYR